MCIIIIINGNLLPKVESRNKSLDPEKIFGIMPFWRRGLGLSHPTFSLMPALSMASFWAF